MSNRVLGLDVGPNSVGWALLDEGKESIIAAGARVFPEGVDRDQQGGEKSKSQTRRDARGTRRQVARRSRRKRQLHDLLVQAHLLPSDKDQLPAVLARNPELPILLSTGYADDKAHWPFIRKKGFPLLQKPYALAVLLQAVRGAMERD